MLIAKGKQDYLFFGLAILCLGWSQYINAKTLNQKNEFSVGGLDFNYSGGISGNIQYLRYSSSRINQSFSDEEEGISPGALNDIVIELETDKSKKYSIQFGFGHLLYQDIVKTALPIAPIGIGLLYGWFDYQFTKNFYIEIGQIKSHKGIEDPISYKNDQILRGGTHRFNPTYYPGFRFNYLVRSEGLRFFVELGAPRIANDAQIIWAIEWEQSVNSIKFLLINDIDRKQIFHLNARSDLFKQLSLGFNVDYNELIDPPSFLNDTAYAYGIYIKPHYGKYAVPIRYEFIDDNVTGTYLWGKGKTITITPTKQINKNFVIRAEFVYATADARIFKSSTSSSDKQFALALQINWQF